MAPRRGWQLGGHTVKMVYTENNATNFAADSVNGKQVALYNAAINSDESRTLTPNGYYAANTLTVTISEDENWVSGRAGTVETYTDKEGHVILKRVYNYYTSAVQMLSTYYVYDDLGNLAFVLPPASGADADGTISQTTLNNLCYQYQYDERGRLSQKKLPGKGWEYTAYNTIDQPVATQDSLQRAQNNWVFTKYDDLGRAVFSGIWNTAISRSSLQASLTAITTNLWEAPTNTGNGYTNVAWPTSSVTETLMLDYYDSYASVPGLPSTYTVITGISNMTRGLPTVKKTAVLNTPTDMLWDVMYYDDLGRSIKTYAQHYLGGTANTSNYDLINTTYNFTNAPTTVTRQHFNTASTTTPLVTIANTYIYDNMGRKLKTWEQITNGSSSPTTKTLISQIDYNEIGQVMTKHLQSTDSVTFLQNIAYTYNERSWLYTSSAPLFAMQLQYNTGTAKQYNGNIIYQYWGTPAGYTNHCYYIYDRLNRLLYGSSADNYQESGLAFDLMGNIRNLNRYQAGTLIDQLQYNYNEAGNPTNQIATINDISGNNTGLVNGTTAYSWDGNGNLLSNTNTTNTGQNKSFSYNLLNLPQVVTLATGTATYTYDATGNKLRKVDVLSGVTTATDYINGIQYGTSSGTTSISFIQTEEGKAVPNGTSYDYQYYLGDNLGNTRVTFSTKTGAAATIQTDDYYPFGMEILRTSPVPNPKNEYLYNKKELQEELTEYDYGARFYDPVLGRWTTIDPLAGKSSRFSPYSYVENNPIRNIDPDGMETYPVITITNEVIGQTQQRVLGYSSSTSNVPTTTVNVYRATLTDTEDASVHISFGVTRDAYVVTPANSNETNGGKGYGPETATNIGFEPAKGSSNVYQANEVPGGVPNGSGNPALRLSQDGSTTLPSTNRQAAVDIGVSKNANTATGVEIHVGGNFTNGAGTSIVGSQACFGCVNKGNSPSNPSNALTKNVVNTAIDQANKSKTDPGRIDVVVQRRGKNIPGDKTVGQQ